MLFIMLSLLLLLFSYPFLGFASACPPGGHPHKIQPWSATQFNSLITFGDSYTDENRLVYFALNNNTPPPPGTLLPESLVAPGGGRTWARYVVQYTGQHVGQSFVPGLELYNYAVSGAVCSNEITPRLDMFQLVMARSGAAD